MLDSASFIKTVGTLFRAFVFYGICYQSLEIFVGLLDVKRLRWHTLNLSFGD